MWYQAHSHRPPKMKSPGMTHTSSAGTYTSFMMANGTAKNPTRAMAVTRDRFLSLF